MNHNIIILSLWVALLASMPASTQPDKYKVEENIDFTQSPVSLRLDAHIPPGKGPFPAVILVHGGGWTAGSKTAVFVVHSSILSREPVSRGSPSTTGWRLNIRILPQCKMS